MKILDHGRKEAPYLVQPIRKPLCSIMEKRRRDNSAFFVSSPRGETVKIRGSMLFGGRWKGRNMRRKAEENDLRGREGRI